jgi:hypothetical protein
MHFLFDMFLTFRSGGWFERFPKTAVNSQICEFTAVFTLGNEKNGHVTITLKFRLKATQMHSSLITSPVRFPVQIARNTEGSTGRRGRQWRSRGRLGPVDLASV